MSVSIKISECHPGLLREIWQIWRKFPTNLSSQIVEVNLGYLRDGEHDDEAAYHKMEISILEKLLSESSLGIAVVHGKENIEDLTKIRGRPFGCRSKTTIIWQMRIPRLVKRKVLLLQGHNDLADLVSSTAWTEDQGSFVLFSDKNDEQIASRFIKQKWTEEDRFIAISVYRDAPSWIVVSNRFSSNKLNDFLASLFDCFNKQ